MLRLGLNFQLLPRCLCRLYDASPTLASVGASKPTASEEVLS